MCIFEILQESCVVIWSFIEKILTHVYLELISRFFFYHVGDLIAFNCIYTRIAFSNKRRSIPRKEDNLQSLAYCIKNQNSTSIPQVFLIFPICYTNNILNKYIDGKDQFQKCCLNFIVWSRFRKRDRLGFNLKGVCL